MPDFRSTVYSPEEPGFPFVAIVANSNWQVVEARPFATRDEAAAFLKTALRRIKGRNGGAAAKKPSLS
jgi:hypothetical protein